MSKPTGVRIIRPDGVPIDCDAFLVCTGTDSDGIEHWTVNHPFRAGLDYFDRFELPAKTALNFSAAVDPAQMQDKITFIQAAPRRRWLDTLRQRFRL